MLVIEQFQGLVREQANAISNLKIDKINVWDGGRNSETGKGATADFVSGIVGSMPPLHDIAKSVGVELPQYLGKMEKAEPDVENGSNGAANSGETPPPEPEAAK
jgi:flotillin